MRTDFCILRRRRGCSLWRMPVGRPDTILDYGRRVAWYLSWCALTMELAHGHIESPGLVATHRRFLTCFEYQRPQRFSERNRA